MKQNKNTIKNRLNKIEREEKTIEKIANFLKTKKGQMFVSRMNTEDMKVLRATIGAPRFVLLYNDSTKNKNLIRAAIKKYNITFPEYKPASIEPPKKVKIQLYLTKEQKKEIAARQPKKMGFAALMHAYEEYAMEKFKRAKPAPTEQQLKEDLFPDELIAGYNNILYIHREYVRNLLCKKYGKKMPKERFFRVFKVLSVTKDPATGREHTPVISEVELDRPLVGDSNTPKSKIVERFNILASSVKGTDSQIKRVKLYDKYGNLLRTKTFIQNIQR